MTPEEGAASLKSAGALLQEGNAAAALQQCQNVLAVSPNHPIAITLAGLAYLELDQLHQARELLDRALQIAPKNLHARFGLARIMEMQHQHRDAARYYREIVEMDSQHSAARVGYANCCVALGSHDEAKDAYLELLQSTGDQHLQRNLGIVALQQNDLSLAEKHFRALLDAFPEDPDAHSQLAGALLKQERFADGWPYYLRRLENFFCPHCHPTKADQWRTPCDAQRNSRDVLGSRANHLQSALASTVRRPTGNGRPDPPGTRQVAP